MSFTAILKILGSILSLWNRKNKYKRSDRMIEIKEKIREELTKSAYLQDRALIDNLEHELHLLSNRESTKAD